MDAWELKTWHLILNMDGMILAKCGKGLKDWSDYQFEKLQEMSPTLLSQVTVTTELEPFVGEIHN